MGPDVLIARLRSASPEPLDRHLNARIIVKRIASYSRSRIKYSSDNAGSLMITCSSHISPADACFEPSKAVCDPPSAVRVAARHPSTCDCFSLDFGV